MSFDIVQFLRINKVLTIWGAFFALVWLINFYGLFRAGVHHLYPVLPLQRSHRRLAAVTKRSRILWGRHHLYRLSGCGADHPVLRAAQTRVRIHGLFEKAPETLGNIRHTWINGPWLVPDMAGPLGKVRDFLSLEIPGRHQDRNPVRSGHHHLYRDIHLRVHVPARHAVQLPYHARFPEPARQDHPAARVPACAISMT